tara:strand:+ start:3261 stop:3749 length:489 start_codon:yes stop_codon:yes gene_type:complete
MAVNQNIGAQSYLQVVEILRNELLSNENITTVTQGDIGDVDLVKQTIFPLAHIIVNNANFSSTIITYNISILIMDMVHNDDTTDEPSIYQSTNEMYVHNTMLNIGNHLTDKLFNGSLYDGNTFVDRSTVNAEPFVDRFENQMAGWAFTFDLVTRNNIDRCNS